VATGGIANGMLAANAVTADKIADGAVGNADLGAGAVTKGKLAAAGGTNNQVLGTDGTNLVWRDPAAGTGTGDISAVTAGAGLAGGGTTGDVTLSVATGGIANAMLAANAVTSDKVADGTVASADVAFNYAGSASKGGAAGDLACSGCVTNSELSASGGTSGKVLKSNGSAVVWSDDETSALTIPLEIRTGNASPLMTIENTSTGGAVKLIGPYGGVLRVTGGSTAVSGGSLIAESTGSGAGATAITAIAQGIGVMGTSGSGIGVQGFSTSGSAGVRGWCYSCSNGVLGEIDSGSGSAVKGKYGTGTTWGSLGASDAGVKGAHGTARTGYIGGADAAVGAVSSAGYAVYGKSSANAVSGAAVRAESTASGGVAIHATNSSTDATIIATNSGSGRIVKFYTGSPASLRFAIENNGDVKADGTYSSPAADFAELLPGREGLEPGDVLAIGADGRLMRSIEAYQASVVGVYSMKPAFLGGAGSAEGTEGLVPLAVVGVVPVKASAENGAIRPGDMLVSSSIPGHAMRAGGSVPNGRGIGKALGRLDSGTGLVTILVILQ
jgi:hypothetical protein